MSRPAMDTENPNQIQTILIEEALPTVTELVLPPREGLLGGHPCPAPRPPARVTCYASGQVPAPDPASRGSPSRWSCQGHCGQRRRPARANWVVQTTMSPGVETTSKNYHTQLYKRPNRIRTTLHHVVTIAMNQRCYQNPSISSHTGPLTARTHDYLSAARPTPHPRSPEATSQDRFRDPERRYNPLTAPGSPRSRTKPVPPDDRNQLIVARRGPGHGF